MSTCLRQALDLLNAIFESVALILCPLGFRTYDRKSGCQAIIIYATFVTKAFRTEAGELGLPWRFIWSHTSVTHVCKSSELFGVATLMPSL